MASLKIVTVACVLLLTVLWGAEVSSGEQASAGETVELPDPNRITVFVGDAFEPRSRSYDSLTVHPAVAENLRYLNWPDCLPYEGRWGPRATVLGLACLLAEEKDKAWLKRAFEIALWQSVNANYHLSESREEIEKYFTDNKITILHLGPTEVWDLTIIDRVFRRAEEARVRSRGAR